MKGQVYKNEGLSKIRSCNIRIEKISIESLIIFLVLNHFFLIRVSEKKKLSLDFSLI